MVACASRFSGEKRELSVQARMVPASAKSRKTGAALAYIGPIGPSPGGMGPNGFISIPIMRGSGIGPYGPRV